MPPPAAAEPVEIRGAAAEGGRVAAVAPLLEKALELALRTARPEAPAQLSAMNVELAGQAQPEEPLLARAWVDRATRTLAFVSGEVLRANGERVAAGAGVFEIKADLSDTGS